MSMSIVMPKYVDALPQVLWWEADEFSLVVCVIGFGVTFHQFLASVLGGVVSMILLRRLKRGSLDGAAQHTLLSSGIIPFNKEFEDILERDYYA